MTSCRKSSLNVLAVYISKNIVTDFFFSVYYLHVRSGSRAWGYNNFFFSVKVTTSNCAIISEM
uniref:Uncharacterized protein n=1 Tax=Anguilla anguilla TaxID=7936 RepID=A0A0E9WNJ2_ANGAN